MSADGCAEFLMSNRQTQQPSWQMLVAGIGLLCFATASLAAETRRPDSSLSSFVEQHCVTCHDRDTKKGNLDLESISTAELTRHPETWEKVVRRLRTRQMPPAEKKKPDEGTYQAVLSRLEGSLDSAAARHPNPGRTETLRRLNRIEYKMRFEISSRWTSTPPRCCPRTRPATALTTLPLGLCRPRCWIDTSLLRRKSAGSPWARLGESAAIPFVRALTSRRRTTSKDYRPARAVEC